MLSQPRPCVIDRHRLHPMWLGVGDLLQNKRDSRPSRPETRDNRREIRSLILEYDVHFDLLSLACSFATDDREKGYSRLPIL